MTRIGPVEIVVTHLTRMHDGHVCIAGIDRVSGRHIRPITMDRMTRGYLDRPGGPIRIGTILRFNTMTPRPLAPEVEDHLFLEAGSDVVGQVTRQNLWSILEVAASPDLKSIFGPAMVRAGRTWAMAEGTGAASLRVLRANEVNGPFTDGYDRVRMTLRGDDGEVATVPVTDLRLFRSQDGKPDQPVILKLESRTKQSNVLLSVGVGRPWARDGDTAKHWLQVNNVHIEPPSMSGAG